MPKSEVYNCDCMTFMQGLEDNAFDLCIADPPYGIDVTRMTLGSGRHKFSRGKSDWDITTPDKRFFDEMFRISKEQIIWGGNYFDLPTCDDWIIWDKLNPNLSFAEGELAWCSIHQKVRIFKHYSAMVDDGGKIHPTQKPIALYEWLIKNYAQQGGVIFDPMMGSQSSRIAAYRMGYDYVGCELDEEYFREGCKRFDRECKNEIVLTNGRVIKQLTLFDDDLEI